MFKSLQSLMCFFVFFLPVGLFSQSTPANGDIVFTQINASDPDQFQLVTLKRLNLTQLNLTESGICPTGNLFRNTEGVILGTNAFSGLTDVPAGTILSMFIGTGTNVNQAAQGGLVYYHSGGTPSFALSTSGDQVIAYTGTINAGNCLNTFAGNIVAGLNLGNSGWAAGGATSANNSLNPTTSFNLAFTPAANSNGFFSGSASGTPAGIISSTNTLANWTTSSSATTMSLPNILFHNSNYVSGSVLTSVTTSTATLDLSGLTFSGTNSDTRYMVVVHSSTPDFPVDRITQYTASADMNAAPSVITLVAGQSISNINGNVLTGDGKVVYFGYGLPSSLTITGLAPSVSYQYRVYAVNGNGYTAKFSNTPASGSFTAQGTAYPSVGVSLSAASGKEGYASTITITATSTAGVTGNQSVQFTLSGPGISGSDFIGNPSLTGAITIPNGQSMGSVEYVIDSDNLVEGTETVTVTLSSPSNQLVLGSPVTASFQIFEPEVTFSPMALSGFCGRTNLASSPQSFTLSAENLYPVSGNLTVIATGSDWEVSADGVTYGSQLASPALNYSSGMILSIPVYVRLKSGLSAGAKSGSLTISGGGEEIKTISLSGTVSTSQFFPGDISIIGFKSLGTDAVAFVNWVTIPASASFTITDRNWGTTSFTSGEGSYVWTNGLNELSPGTVTLVSGATADQGSVIGSISGISQTGDNIFLYEGTASCPQFIHGVTFNGTWGTYGNLPEELNITNGNIVFSSQQNNNEYPALSRSTLSSFPAYRSAIHNPANWTNSSSSSFGLSSVDFTFPPTLTTDSISGSPFVLLACQPTPSGNLYFTTGGSYNPGNVFLAQLSDANGSFSSPVTIGSGSVSPVSFVIPASTPTGANYKIRVLAQSPFTASSPSDPFTVTSVSDNTAPEISGCPADINLSTASGSCGQLVVWIAPTAGDNCQVTSFTSTHNSGDIFPVGSTTVTYTAVDAAGNSSTCSFIVNITDDTAPVISGCPADINLSTSSSSCDQVVTWTDPTASDNCDLISLTSTHNSGDIFSPGTTTVTYTAVDATGNSSTCSFSVTITDDTAPVISGCPSDITVSLDLGSCVKAVSWVAPTASDNCALQLFDGNYNSGADFPVGVTTVTYVAKDDAGNESVCSFTVTVLDPWVPQISSVTADESSICEISTTNLTANGVTASNVDVNWWTGTNGSGTNVGSGLTINIGPGTYYALVTGACSPAAEASVTVESVPVPTAANAGADRVDASTCSSTSITLAANTPVNGTGQWTISQGNGGSISNPGSSTSTFSGVIGEIYELRWTTTNSPCPESTDEMLVYFNRPPTTANAGAALSTSTANCDTRTVNLSANTPVHGTGSWSIVTTNAPGLFSNATSPTSTFTGAASINYSLLWTISLAPCPPSTSTVAVNMTFTGANGCNVWTGSVDTNWSNAGNWRSNAVPTSTQNAVIPNVTNRPVVFAANAGVRNLFISNGSGVRVNSGRILDLTGNWVNNGQADIGLGKVKFTSTTTTLSLSGVNIFEDLETAAPMSWGSGNTQIRREFRLSASNVTTGSAHPVVFKSVAGKTAYMISTGTGSITSSTLQYELYLSGSVGPRYVATPAAHLVSAWSDDFQIVGLNGVNWIAPPANATPWPTLWQHQENKLGASDAFYSYTQSNLSLARGRGYMMRIEPTSSNATINGTAGWTGQLDATALNTTNGNFSQAVTFTKSTPVQPAADGQNVLGNPYMCPIDWPRVYNGNSTIVQPTLYTSRPTGQWTGLTATYNATTNAFTNGGTRVIARNQGFWVFCRSGTNGATISRTMTYTASMMEATATPTFYKNEEPLDQMLRLEVKKGDMTDDIVMYFRPESAEGFDETTDAYKLNHLNPELPNLYSLAGSTKLAINGLPGREQEGTIVPLGLEIGEDGEYSFRGTEINFGGETEVYLNDRKLNKYYNLRTEEAKYSFTEGEDLSNRFYVVFGKPEVAEEGSNLIKVYAHGNKVLVDLSRLKSIDADIQITNLLGQQIANVQHYTGSLYELPVNDVTAATLLVRVVNGQQQLNQKVVISGN